MAVRRRYSAPPPGMPVREVVYHEIYDTKELDHHGVSHLNFFRNPNSAGLYYSNMSAAGHLLHPQEFRAYGIGAEILQGMRELPFLFSPADIAAAKQQRDNFEKLKTVFLEEAVVTFVIGAKCYLTVPLSHFFSGGFSSLPVGAVSTTDFPRILPAPISEADEDGGDESGEENEVPVFSKKPSVDFEEEPQLDESRHSGAMRHPQDVGGGDASFAQEVLYDMDSPLFIGIGTPGKEGFYHHVMVERFKKKPLHVIVTDKQPTMGYIDLTITHNGVRSPLEILAQQSFFVQVSWHGNNTHSYDPGLLGNILMRFTLRGVLLREVQ